MKDKLYYKVSRDAVHSEIFLYPLEIIFADTKAVQRLRYLSQLAGAESVYPGATHTRFIHSLGTMHLSGLYAKNIYPENHSKFRILRLSGLLHDLGHGPYSHQFDDVVYKNMGFDDGHDSFRKIILHNHLTDDCLNVLNSIKDYRTLDDFYKDISLTLEKKVDADNVKDSLNELMEKILEVYEGENTGSVDFNLIQGPLGADRLDFVLRDSYYAGTRHFGTGAVDRLIRNSFVEGNKICYSIKVIDDIYSSLFARFMMYKNVYFHKTSRAADLMIQEILKVAYEILNLSDMVNNYNEFLKLTDQKIINQIEFLYELVFENKFKDNSLSLNPEIFKNSEKISYAYDLVKRLKRRDLWKLVLERPFFTKGVDPTIVSRSVAQDSLEKIKINLKNEVKKDIPNEDKEELYYILDNFNYLFKIDTPYKLSLVHPDEFLANDVFIKDIDDEVITFEKVYQKYPAYKLIENNLIQIVRIYIKEDRRDILRKYSLIPTQKKASINTRW
jgi:hypothetical protein